MSRGFYAVEGKSERSVQVLVFPILPSDYPIRDLLQVVLSDFILIDESLRGDKRVSPLFNDRSPRGVSISTGNT